MGLLFFCTLSELTWSQKYACSPAECEFFYDAVKSSEQAVQYWACDFLAWFITSHFASKQLENNICSLQCDLKKQLNDLLA